MKLLFVTQAVDLDDAVLSAYHDWVAEVAKHFDTVTVICLKEGRHALPANVEVYSLGKEHGRASRAAYALRFLKLAWQLRPEYDTIFVHMNQEYILIAGWLWKLLGKPIYFWRNHYAGSWLTDLAVHLSTKVFCTSAESYTAKYAKTVRMPVGVHLERFTRTSAVVRTPHSILFLARMTPSKRPEMLLAALATLVQRDVHFHADFYGSPLPEDAAYYANLKEVARQHDLSSYVTFHPGIPNSDTPKVYQSHEIFVNTSPSGMLDKTIFEAAAAGCMVLAASSDWAGQVPTDLSFTHAEELAQNLTTLLGSSESQRQKYMILLEQIANSNSLQILGHALEQAMV